MKRNYLYKLSQLVLMMTFILGMTGCNETIDSLFSDGISEGEEVMFTTSLPGAPATRGAQEDYEEEMNKFQAVNKAYEFTIDMYADGKVIGTGTYGPDTLKTDGTLSPKTGHTPLYWSSTTLPYAFKAVAGTEDLSPVQNTQKDWLQQDRLEGYGYVQLWDENNNNPTDNLDALNYHTAKEWKTLNNQSKMVSDNNDLKKIPLYLQHKRSLISIILKAGEGVTRKALAYDVAENDLSAKIISYDTAGSPIEIMPLAKEEKIHYDKDKNGGAEDSVSTTRYDAIVYPYDYSANPSTDLITKISLSGQHYSFYAQNDYLFDDPDNPSKASYRLEPGKRLVITVTLSRDSRKILMSAYVEDWTEEVTNTICDDYGNAGEPIKISNRTELITFLESDEKNKPGNVALVTNNIDLQDWPSTYDLCCTLNLGGKTIISNHRFLNSLQDAATLQNGTIQIGGVVDAAVAETNKGAIEDIRITEKDTTTTVQATAAGVVVHNTGTISKCHSALKVSGGTGDYVGGIAATSLSGESKIAIIESCTVTNRVDGGQTGGGIVGKANGYINNNTFEYGITLNQNKSKFKNIVGERDESHTTFKADGNAWPTVDKNLVDDATEIANAVAADKRYSGIIDCEEELQASTGKTYNLDNSRYRLAKDITVQKTTGDVNYELDGNGKTISTEAMIFNDVQGKIHDLTVLVVKDLVATQDATTATDAIAPLAFSVHGSSAEISDIKVKTVNDAVIKASNPAGVVVWAYDNATVKNCEVRVNIFANVATSINQGRKFAGGIVSTVSKATVTQCVFHSTSKLEGTASSVLYLGGIVGGIEKKEGTTDNPELTITDCTSFILLSKDAHHGCVLGNAKFGEEEATSKACQGNWWQTDCNGVGTPSGSDEALLGKRNAITPLEKEF